MSKAIELKYSGKALEDWGILRDEKGKEAGRIPPYYPDEELIKSVELAFVLRRPLLLMGKPGCGKTKLAEAVAFELYGNEYRDYYFEWHVKSTSKARDGLYSFDHLARLRDVQLAKTGSGNPETAAPEKLDKYLQLGPLGQAFLQSRKGRPAVVLIDEIDKADIDFPNDLLLELDQKRFTIDELDRHHILREVRAEESPIIFITSNEEKELPPAFLRRCLFHYIEFPQKEIMKKIVAANFPGLDKDLLGQVLDRFYHLRQAMHDDPNTEKEVSTSELIDWVKVINHFNQEGRQSQINGEQLVHYQALLKTLNDFKLHHKKQ